MIKILVNKKINGLFSLSIEAVKWLAEKNHPIAKAELNEYNSFGQKFWYGNGHTHKFDGYKRNDPLLIECFETLLTLANGTKTILRIVKIPDNINWIIQSNMGYEWIAEKHRTWD